MANPAGDGFPPARERRRCCHGRSQVSKIPDSLPDWAAWCDEPVPESRWQTLPGMDSRLRGNDGGVVMVDLRSPRSQIHYLIGPAGAMNQFPSHDGGPAGDGFPPARERRGCCRDRSQASKIPDSLPDWAGWCDEPVPESRWQTLPGMDSRLRGNDGGVAVIDPKPPRSQIHYLIGPAGAMNQFPSHDGRPCRGWIPACAGTTEVLP